MTRTPSHTSSGTPTGTSPRGPSRLGRAASRIGRFGLVGALVVAGGYVAGTITTVGARNAAPAPAQVAAPQEVSGFVPIAAYRTYDSRVNPDISDKIYIKTDIFVDAALDLNGVEQIPDEATAVTFNITITQTEGWGYVQVVTPGTGLNETSTVNWSGADQTVANSGSALLTTGGLLPELENNLVFHVDGSSGGTHVIIDITGYYVPIN